MSFCQAMLQNCANLMAGSIVPSPDTTSTDTDTNIIRDIRTQYGSLLALLAGTCQKNSNIALQK